MSEPFLKDNEHIRADDNQFRAALERARATFGRIEGVVSVGYGLKEKSGDFTRDIAILVYVLKKVPDDQLSPERRIPATFEGYRTDVRVLLPEEAAGLGCNDEAKYATITGGIQIEAAGDQSPLGTVGLGTLGCLVQKRGDTGADNVYLLSCEHVIMAEGQNVRFGDCVYHPFRPRTVPAVRTGIKLGTIQREYIRNGHVDPAGRPVLNEPDPGPPNPHIATIDNNFAGVYVDCAAVRIDLGSFCCGSACTRNDVQYLPTIPFLNLAPYPPGFNPANIDRIVDVRDLRNDPSASVVGSKVVKVGRTTGRTIGQITAVNIAAHSIVLDHVIAFRYHVFEIVLDNPPPATNPCTGTNAFSGSGDSGSLIVDMENRAVGLLYAKSMVANDAGRFITRACFIVPVLDTLGMCIPTTTGNSHGSSLATDGSGLAMVGGELGLPEDDGKTLFSTEAAAQGRIATPKSPAPLAQPATEEDRARMFPLLAELRTTERGRELHDDFDLLSREIAYLVRHCRPVTVTWHRNRGPAFLTGVLAHLKDSSRPMPKEIDGISRTMLLERMGDVLFKYGSNPMRQKIARHRDVVMQLAQADTARECLEMLRRAETAEVSG